LAAARSARNTQRNTPNVTSEPITEIGSIVDA